jgi:hypothetical protein
VDEGITRLFVLKEGVAMGVLAAGVLKEEVPDRVLSLLRERLDDVGEMESCAGAMLSGSVLRRTPLSFALRLRARSLCSLKKLWLLLGSVVGENWKMN